MFGQLGDRGVVINQRGIHTRPSHSSKSPDMTIAVAESRAKSSNGTVTSIRSAGKSNWLAK